MQRGGKGVPTQFLLFIITPLIITKKLSGLPPPFFCPSHGADTCRTRRRCSVMYHQYTPSRRLACCCVPHPRSGQKIAGGEKKGVADNTCRALLVVRSVGHVSALPCLLTSQIPASIQNSGKKIAGGEKKGVADICRTRRRQPCPICPTCPTCPTGRSSAAGSPQTITFVKFCKLKKSDILVFLRC